VGAAAAVGFSPAEDLSGHRGDLALAEDQVAEEVGDRTPFGPLEVQRACCVQRAVASAGSGRSGGHMASASSLNAVASRSGGETSMASS